MKSEYTEKQGQYLAFIHYYSKIHEQPPGEADMQRYFKVTAPAVHRMVLTLEKQGLIERVPGRPRTIRVLLPREELPDLEQGKTNPFQRVADVTGFGDSDKVLLLALGEGEEMASWEPALRAAIRQLAGERDIIERIDHDEKIIEIKLDVTDPSLLRGIEEAVNQVAPGYRVEQLA